MNSFESFEGKESADNLEEIAERVQDLYITLAESYLPKEDSLRERIINYYADTEKLKSELATVFEDLKEKEIKRRIKNLEDTYANKTFFIEHHQEIFERTDAFKRRERRREEKPLATEAEYQAGVYKEALERPVQEAVFTLLDKGYKTFESGFREDSDRDQYIGMYNKEVSLPDSLIHYFEEKGFEVSAVSHEDRTIISIHPLSAEAVRLLEWKEVWDDLAEKIPPAPEEDLGDVSEYAYHAEFREWQDELRSGE